MKILYTSRGDCIEHYDTVAAAVLDIVQHWHESDKPDAYVIRDEEDLIAATICPVGSDMAVVVYANGQIDTYRQIQYMRDAIESRIVATQWYQNDSSVPTRIEF